MSQPAAVAVSIQQEVEFAQLPDAVWELIIRQLKLRQKAVLRQTCRRLRDLVNSTNAKVKVDPSYAEDCLKWKLCTRFPRLQHFEPMKPSEVDWFTDEMVAQLALRDLSHAPQLTSLNLENCTHLTVAGLAALALSCPGIKILTLPQICSQLMTDSMLLVLAKLPLLQKLKLVCCKHCDELSLQSLSALTGLTALELEDYGQGLVQVTKFTMLSNLQSIMVWSDFTLDMADAMHNAQPGAHAVAAAAVNNPLAAAAAAAAAAVANLAVHALQEDDAGQLQEVEQLAHQLQLTEQVLNRILEGKSALLQWVSQMTQLTHVDIQRVDVDNEDLDKLAALKSLKHLGVGDLNLHQEPWGPLSSVTKLVAHNILNQHYVRTTFPNLLALSCDASDIALLDIMHMSTLTNLFLWNSPSDNITDSGLGLLSTVTALDTFRLEGAVEVTNKGWMNFADTHPSLTRLDVLNCPGITDVGIILSLPQLRKLRKVSFCELPIDVPSLASVVANCPFIESIEVVDCRKLSQAGVQQVLSTVHKPDLDVVFRRGRAWKLLHC